VADHVASGGAPPDNQIQTADSGPTSRDDEVGAAVARPDEEPHLNEEHSLERMVFFSDAVIAIAMTLLALELPIPGVGQTHKTNSGLWRSLGANWGDHYFPFLLSFVVIAAFWLSHHRFFGRVARLGPGTLRLNMIFLLLIVLLPFVTRVLGVDSDYTIGPVLYAAVVAATCFVLGSMVMQARRHDMLRDDGLHDASLRMAKSLYAAGAVFAVSIPLAFWSTEVAAYSWLVLSVALHFAGELMAKWRGRTVNAAVEGLHP